MRARLLVCVLVIFVLVVGLVVGFDLLCCLVVGGCVLACALCVWLQAFALLFCMVLGRSCGKMALMFGFDFCVGRRYGRKF